MKKISCECILEKSKKYYLTYEQYEDEEMTANDIVEYIITDSKLKDLKEIIIGCFGACYDNEENAKDLLNGFIKYKDRLQHIESFYIGDMTYEECEVSWIYQTSYEEFLKSFPNLKKLTIKGSNSLSLGNIDHKNLEYLEIICGGLPSDIIYEIACGKLPMLKTLILYLGAADYGFNGDIEDIEMLLKKGLFPKLKHLGLVDSEYQDKVANIVIKSDILDQLNTLELAYGNLSDIGGKIILDNSNRLKNIEKLNLTYHFLSNEMMENLEKLPFIVILEDQNVYDDRYGNYPLLTE